MLTSNFDLFWPDVDLVSTLPGPNIDPNCFLSHCCILLIKWHINPVPHIHHWTSSLWWPSATWPDLDLELCIVHQVLQFVFLTCWHVLAECDQLALLCLGSWPNIVEACNFDLWPDLGLTCDLLKKNRCPYICLVESFRLQIVPSLFNHSFGS